MLVEINGVKLEVNERTARTVAQYRVGDSIEIAPLTEIEKLLDRQSVIDKFDSQIRKVVGDSNSGPTD